MTSEDIDFLQTPARIRYRDDVLTFRKDILPPEKRQKLHLDFTPVHLDNIQNPSDFRMEEWTANNGSEMGNITCWGREACQALERLAMHMKQEGIPFDLWTYRKASDIPVVVSYFRPAESEQVHTMASSDLYALDERELETFLETMTDIRDATIMNQNTKKHTNMETLKDTIEKHLHLYPRAKASYDAFCKREPGAANNLVMEGLFADMGITVTEEPVNEGKGHELLACIFDKAYISSPVFGSVIGNQKFTEAIHQGKISFEDFVKEMKSSMAKDFETSDIVDFLPDKEIEIRDEAWWAKAQKIADIAQKAVAASHASANATLFHDGQVAICMQHEQPFTYIINGNASVKDNLAMLSKDFSSKVGKGNRTADRISSFLEAAPDYAEGKTTAFTDCMENLRYFAKEYLRDEMIDGIHKMQNLGMSDKDIKKILKAQTKKLADGLSSSVTR